MLGGALPQIAERLCRTPPPDFARLTFVDTSEAMLDRAREATASAPAVEADFVHWTDVEEEILPVDVGAFDGMGLNAMRGIWASGGDLWCVLWVLVELQAMFPVCHSIILPALYIELQDNNLPHMPCAAVIACLGLHWINNVPVSMHGFINSWHIPHMTIEPVFFSHARPIFAIILAFSAPRDGVHSTCAEGFGPACIVEIQCAAGAPRFPRGRTRLVI